MKQKWIVWILAVILCLQLVPTAYAGPNEVSALCAYYTDNTVYAFAWLTGGETVQAQPKAHLIAGMTQVSEQETARRLIDGKAPEYLILIDNSTSMGSYVPQMKALCAALFEGGRQISVNVATFGVEFKVRAEALQSIEEVYAVINQLRFEEPGTDICGGVALGVDYLRSKRWEPGELCQLILLTDGIPYYSRNSAVQDESKKAAAEVLEQVLRDAPQVYVHLACLDAWDPDTYMAIKACEGIGLDLMALDKESASFDGGLIASWYDSLYALEFPLSSFKENLSLRTEDNEFISIPRCTEIPVDLPEEGRIFDLLPAVIGQEDEPEPGSSETEPPDTQPSEEPSETSEATEPSDVTESSDAEATDAAEEAQPTEESGQTEPSLPMKPQPELTDTDKPFPIWIAAAGGGLLVLLILVLLLVFGRKKEPKQSVPQVSQAAPQARRNAPVDPRDPNVLPLRVRILTGSLQGQSLALALKDSLTIGSDPQCDLVLPDAGIARFHTQIFLEANAVMVKDLNSDSGTAVNGLRLCFPNPLRSGDQLAVGLTVLLIEY